MHRKGKASLSATLLFILSIQILLSVKIATSETVGTYHPTGYNLVGATTRISGTLTQLQSDNSVYMTFGSYFSGTDTSDFVDNNAFDVDSSADKGTHANFSAQQYGPDGVFDVLTEQTSNIVFEQVTVSSEQLTMNTVWTDVPGANVSFTPSSSTEEWLIFVTADIRSSSTLQDQARFRYDVNGVFQRGETGVQQGITSISPIDPYNVYFHFSRITGATSQQTVKFQFQASSGATAYARNIHILCIRLDLADLEYTEVNGSVSITGVQTLASLQFTPLSSSDYIIAYCALVSELPTGSGAETWLDYGSGTSLYPDAWSTPNTRRIHTDRDQFEPHGLFTKINLNASEHTFRVQAQLRNAGETSTARDVRIAAFRVDAFDLLEFDEDTAVSSTTGANTVRSVVNTPDIGEQADYLILAGIHTISNGTSSREAGGIEIDDVFVQRKGDQRLSLNEIARIASHYAYVKTRSTSFKVETTYGTGGTGSDTAYSKQSVIYVLKIPKNYELDLEVQWTNVDNDETNGELAIYFDKGNNTHSVDATGGYLIIGDGTPDWGSTTGTISFWIEWDTVGDRPWGQHDNMETRFSGTNLVIDWGAAASITSNTSFTTGKWYFIAVVWNENTDDLYLYVGDQDNPPTLDTYNNAWASATSSVGVTENNFMASRGGVGPTNGHGEELRYWDINRTLAEIQSDYDSELTGSETNLKSYFKLNNNFDDIGLDDNDGSALGSYSFSFNVPFDATPTENLRVDVWNGTAWQNLFTDLTNGWNNVSVSSYLNSSTFTIRFKGDTETGDATQDSWNTDVTLLHVWSNEYTTEVEFTGLSDNETWAQLDLSIDSAWTVGSISVTLQLYNYSLGGYPTNGNGSMSYVSSATINTDETKNETITVNSTHFRNATGYWKLKVKGVKITDTPFDFKADLIRYEATYVRAHVPFGWVTPILFALPVVFGFLFLLTVKRRRKKKTDEFSESFGLTHQQMIGKKMLLEIDPTSDYNKALLKFAYEARKSGEPLFIFTSMNSALRSTFNEAENVKLFILTSNTSALQQVNEKVILLPANDLSVLLSASLEVLKVEKGKTINMLFDSISSIMIRCGFQKTYNFMHFLLEAISSPKATALFVFNPAAHDPVISSSIRALFRNQLAYTKSGPKVGTL